jgi:hypothetical protein
MTSTSTRKHPPPTLRGNRSGGIASVADELRRLTSRDRWLLDLLASHQAFSTEQIASLGFDHLHTARNRLNLLASREVLIRFRDCIRPGSQAWRWTLGWVGASYLAARDGGPTPRRTAVEDKANRLAASPRLGHLLGCNGVFVDLAAQARHTPGAGLDTWWSERACRAVCGDLVRPDGHGVWRDEYGECSFWLEFDLGTEHLPQMLAKLDGYAALHAATGLRHAVLWWLSSPRREASLQQRLATHPAVAGGLLVATATAGHPAAPVWQPAVVGGRYRLTQLPAAS